VDQQFSVSNAFRNRCHDGVELFRRDWTRVGNWDTSVANPACLVRNLVGAERDDGGDAERVLGCKPCRIFQATEIKTFPNPRYHSPPASLSVDLLWTPTQAERNSLRLA